MKITIPNLIESKSQRKLTCLTAYDALFASIFDGAVDMILVGDSLGNVFQGNATTLNVEVEHMAYHVNAVSKAVQTSLVIGDLPFMSYHLSTKQALKSSATLIKAGASAVKLEGGLNVADQIKAISDCDIPVIGHIGLTPQSYHRMGGYKQQGKEGLGRRNADQVYEDALVVQNSGASLIVLEGIPEDLAENITTELSIPTIGIAAGNKTDGQVLVFSDFLGISDKIPKFVTPKLNLREQIQAAVGSWVKEVND